MVKVRDSHQIDSDISIDRELWVENLADNPALTEEMRALMKKACVLSQEAERNCPVDRNSWSGSTGCYHIGLEMAEILLDLGMNNEGLIAAILYRAVRERKLAVEEVEKTFGKEVANLIRSVLRMAIISTLRNDSLGEVFGHDSNQQAAKVREMLVSIIDDVRVALIKIAERTCAIRAVKNASEEKRVRVAREVFDVYAPLAHRLGIGHLKWELEDLAFRYLEPDDYKNIARLLDERRMDRQQYIDEVVEQLKKELAGAGIRGEVAGRAKHIYSIWKKMRRKGIGFSQVYDIRALRVLVPTVADCYSVLGIVHGKWHNIPNEFDDYIATPKENGYRSLHTAVIGPGQRILEIQIRTFDMHSEAELGVCAHWQYKGTDSTSADRNYESKIAWLRQVLEWHEEIEEENVNDLFKNDGSPERLYVFTPEGHVVDLPKGSTPLDFAYRIHTQIGHRCRGAKVNGRIVALNSELHTGDQVQILTAKEEAPSRDWLSPALGYLHTGRARAKVLHWFRKQNREKNIISGQHVLDREFRQLGLQNADFEALAGKFNKNGSEGLYEAVGAGDLSAQQVINAAQAQIFGGKKARRSVLRKSESSKVGDSGFYIYGVGNLLTKVAHCCNPVPGDDISGYITSGYGVSIHRQDCGNMLRLRNIDPERVIKVSWGGAPKKVYSVPIRVRAYDRSGLLSDLTSVLEKANIFILSLFSGETRKGIATSELKVEVSDVEQLSTLMSRLRQIPNVIDVQRISE